jgi:hypothetical protein
MTTTYIETSRKLLMMYNILLTILVLSLVASSYLFILNDKKLDSCASDVMFIRSQEDYINAVTWQNNCIEEAIFQSRVSFLLLTSITVLMFLVIFSYARRFRPSLTPRNP